jgi:hypothetical protein
MAIAAGLAHGGSEDFDDPEDRRNFVNFAERRSFGAVVREVMKWAGLGSVCIGFSFMDQWQV